MYKICDFGGSTPHCSQEYLGTLDYVAPEILLQNPYDESIDWWSLGCIAYELDVGRPPFYNIESTATKTMITKVNTLSLRANMTGRS